MRGFTKKFISAAVTASFLSQGAVLAAISSDTAGTRYEEPIQVLSALNIMIGDENGDFRPDDTIIRSEVTKMAVCALGLEAAAEASGGTSKFPDVSSSHWANGYINIASDLGLVIGDDTGHFRPNDKITYAEAMTIMVRALGYEPKALENGGFPSGYVLTAGENGLTDNVQGTSSQPISRGNVAYLTMNALEAKIMEQTSFGANPEYSILNKTLLESRLGVTKHEGQITAIPNSGIYGDSKLSDNQVQIDEHVYETEYNMNNLLGFNVTYYVRNENKSSEAIILALPTSGANKTLEIKADLFEKVKVQSEKKLIEYFEAETSSKTKTAEISNSARLIYNGKYADFSDELLDLTDKSGKITLLDTDKNGIYDIVYVTVYTNIVVDTVSSNGKITDKYNAAPIHLNKEVKYVIERGLERINVSDLKEYDVLSVSQSLDKKLYSIIVTNDYIDGKVSATDSDGYVINGKTYKTAQNYTDSINIGLEGKFYLDTDGKIAAVDTSSRLSSGYAYLIKAYSTDDDTVKFKLFTKDGKETTIELADKIRYNNSRSKKAAEILNILKNSGSEVSPQLITYALNSDGKLSQLNTAKDNSNNGNSNLSVFTLNYNLKNAVYNETQNKLGNIRITDETVIFNIPADSTASSDFSIASLSMFEDKESYDALIYDRTEDYTAKAIVVTNASHKISADAPIAIVKSVSSGTNSNDEITDVLRALVGGKEQTLFADTQNILKTSDGSSIAEGDIIQYKTNSDGEIVSIRILMSIADKKAEKIQNPAENSEIVYGKVTKKFDSSINVTVNDGEAKNFTLTDAVTTYSIDTTVSKNKITLAGINDIQPFDSEDKNRIFIKLYKDTVQEIVIIK